MLKRDKMKKPVKKEKGQSTVEYIILVAAIIGALLIFLNPNGGPFRTAVDGTMSSGTNGMEDMANRLSTSRPLSP